MRKLTMVLKKRKAFQELRDSDIGLLCHLWGVPREPELEHGKYFVVIDGRAGSIIAFFHSIDEIKWEE